ncbi:hypothetical protein KIPB_012602, partial [Kipferlia bialata]|eukprot:g12602.t1
MADIQGINDATLVAAYEALVLTTTSSVKEALLDISKGSDKWDALAAEWGVMGGSPDVKVTKGHLSRMLCARVLSALTHHHNLDGRSHCPELASEYLLSLSLPCLHCNHRQVQWRQRHHRLHVCLASQPTLTSVPQGCTRESVCWSEVRWILSPY